MNTGSCNTREEQREKGFVLDCVAVSYLARGYEYACRSFWSVLPPYDARDDPHAVSYTSARPVRKILRKLRSQKRSSCTAVAERDVELRNAAGAGYSSEQVSGHVGPETAVKPLIGYNGRYGFRRNTPNLRDQPSSFGQVTTLALH